MTQAATLIDRRPARRTCTLFALTLILLGVTLTLPVGALAFTSSGTGGWHAQNASAAGSSASLGSVTFVDAEHGWVVGSSYSDASSSYTPVILSTSDAGATWNAQDAGDSSGYDAYLRAVALVDEAHGWVVGHNDDGALILATSGGATWSAQDASNAGSSYASLDSVTFVDAQHGWAVGSTHDEASDSWVPLILATKDGGVTWDAQDAGHVDALMSSLNDVTFVDAQHGWAVGSTGGGYNESRIILATSDGGATWNAQNAQTPDGWEGLYSVSFIDAKRGWAVGGNGIATNGSGYPLIITTQNGGVTWSAQDASSAVKDGFLGSVTFIDAKNGWAVGHSTRRVDGMPGFAFSSLILATADGGASWHKQRTNDTEGFGGLDFIDATHGWVVGSTFIDATDTWAPLILATTTGGFPSAGPTPTLTLKLSGLAAGTLKLGQTPTATGAVKPLGLVGSRVALSVQMKTGTTWAKVKTTSASIRPKGNYSWKYVPAANGAYRMRAQVAATDAYPAATTQWLAFTVR